MEDLRQPVHRRADHPADPLKSTTWERPTSTRARRVLPSRRLSAVAQRARESRTSTRSPARSIGALHAPRSRAVPARSLPHHARRGDRHASGDRRPDDRRVRPLGLRAAHGRRRRRARTTRCCSRRTSPGPGPAWSACSTPARASRASAARTRRLWTDAPDWTADDVVHGAPRRRGARPGAIELRRRQHPRRGAGPRSRPPARRRACSPASARSGRSSLMLGDTSMGMINGYFGPRLLDPIGFSEHKVDQAWLIDRGKARRPTSASTTPSRSCRTSGVDVPLERARREDFTEDAHARAAPRLPRRARPARRVPGRLPRLAVPARALIRSGRRATSPKASSTRTCRPESERRRRSRRATEADQGNLVPMELMKRLCKRKGLHEAVMFHDVRWGAEHDGRFLWVLLNSGLVRRLRLQPRSRHAAGRPLLPPAAALLPDPRRHVRRREPARRDHLGARLASTATELVDGHRPRRVGRSSRPSVRDAWWEGTTRAVAVHGRRPGLGRDDAHGPLPATTSPSPTATSSARWSRCRRRSASACACWERR